MARFSGLVKKSDLEGGVVQLVTDDGKVFELEGPVGSEWLDRRVVVNGTVDRNALSFTMTGPRLLVTSIEGG
jgi:hypothetical protein